MSCNTRTIEAASEVYATNAFDVGSTAPVAMAAADPRRRSVTILVDADATTDVYLVTGPAGTTSRGVRLTAGGGFTMNTSAAVFCRTAAGTARVYVVTESGEVG